MDRVEYINIPNLPLFLKMPDRPCPGKQFSPIPNFFRHFWYFEMKEEIRAQLLPYTTSL